MAKILFLINPPNKFTKTERETFLLLLTKQNYKSNDQKGKLLNISLFVQSG